MNGAPVELVSNHNETNDRGQRSTALLECYDANEAQMKITCFIVEDSHRYLLVSSYRIIEQFGKPIEKLKVRIHFTDTPGSEPLVLTRTHYWLVWESDQKHMRTIILELTDTCVEWMRAQGCQFLTANEPCPLLKITLFQYPKDLVEKKLCCSSGEVIKVEAQSVFYSAGSGPGAEGGPIVNTGNSAVIGLHLEKCANPENGAQGIVNKGSSIDPIIKHYK